MSPNFVFSFTQLVIVCDHASAMAPSLPARSPPRQPLFALSLPHARRAYPKPFPPPCPPCLRVSFRASLRISDFYFPASSAFQLSTFSTTPPSLPPPPLGRETHTINTGESSSRFPIQLPAFHPVKLVDSVLKNFPPPRLRVSAPPRDRIACL